MSAINQKLLNSKELDTILSLWLFHLEESLNTEKPFTQKTFSQNNLWVERKTPSLALGKVTALMVAKGIPLKPAVVNEEEGEEEGHDEM